MRVASGTLDLDTVSALAIMLRHYLVALTTDVLAVQFEEFKQQLDYRRNQ
jgi:hypothetical protein